MVNLGAEHENLDQKAYLILKNMIIDRKLLPGDKILQEKLARELGISRTPLVSAIKYLEHEFLDAMILVASAPYVPPDEERSAGEDLNYDSLDSGTLSFYESLHPGGEDQIRMLLEQVGNLSKNHVDMSFTPPVVGGHRLSDADHSRRPGSLLSDRRPDHHVSIHPRIHTLGDTQRRAFSGGSDG